MQKEAWRTNSLRMNLLAQGLQVAVPGPQERKRPETWCSRLDSEAESRRRGRPLRTALSPATVKRGEGWGKGPLQGGGASEAPRERAGRSWQGGQTRAQRGATFARGGARRGRVPGNPPTQKRGRGGAERPGGRAGDEPRAGRRHYGHPAAGRQDRRSVVWRPPLVLCAQLRLGALAVREGRGRGGPRGRGGQAAGPGGRWRGGRMRGQ